jgi:hypothetical protein
VTSIGCALLHGRPQLDGNVTQAIWQRIIWLTSTTTRVQTTSIAIGKASYREFTDPSELEQVATYSVSTIGA